MKVGILGAGQLARMLALAAHPLGLDISCLGQAHDPAAAVANVHPVPASLAEWRSWLAGLDVLTFEHENVDFDLLDQVSDCCPFSPSLAAVRLSSDRLHEKMLFEQLGLRVAPYQAVDTLADLLAAIERCGAPGFLKRRRFGFDGRGQSSIADAAQAKAVWSELDSGGCGFIYEAKVDFKRELSQILVRAASGEQRFYPLSENLHRRGILRQARCLATGDPSAAQAQRMAGRMATHLQYVGTLALELFEVDGQLLANEMAPRVHNSGHWSIEASITSQFENHLRAVCGWPLGSCASRPALMVNCLGQMPAPELLLAIDGAHYHDYAKQARPQRKLGHVTLLLDHQQQQLAPIEKILALTDGD